MVDVVDACDWRLGVEDVWCLGDVVLSWWRTKKKHPP